MAFKVIVTLGPAILNKDNLKRIDAAGNCIFRINGAHTEVQDIKKIADTVRSILPKARLLVDLPGNKVRTAHLSDPIRLRKGELFDLHPFQLNFPDFHRFLKKGDIILANDSIYRFRVESVSGAAIKLFSYCDGELLSNKGLHLPGAYRHLPFLLTKDRGLLTEISSCGIDYTALSYVRSAKDIKEAQAFIRKQGGEATRIIVKIETAEAVKNLADILKSADTILLDRGDLSADIGMLHLPSAQERILSAARKKGIRVYLATQFLKGMLHSPIPLIAETLDLYNTIRRGIDGVQLSEETAVGEYPCECIEMIFDMFRQVRRDRQ